MITWTELLYQIMHNILVCHSMSIYQFPSNIPQQLNWKHGKARGFREWMLEQPKPCVFGGSAAAFPWAGIHVVSVQRLEFHSPQKKSLKFHEISSTCNMPLYFYVFFQAMPQAPSSTNPCLEAQLCSFGRGKEEPWHCQSLSKISEDPTLK